MQALIQGGAIGISLATLYVLYKVTGNHIEHHEAQVARFERAMDRNTDAWVKNAEAMSKLTERLK